MANGKKKKAVDVPKSPSVVLAAGFIVVVGIWILYGNLRDFQQPAAPRPEADRNLQIGAPQATTSKELPLPAGKQFFRVAGGGKNGPRIAEGYIDPFDPARGAEQVMNVKVMDSSPVTSVEVTIKTDTKSQTYPLVLNQGTNTEGFWQGSWQMNDTYSKTYMATIRAISDRGTTKIDITLR